MPFRNVEGGTSSLTNVLGQRSACLAEGVPILLQRMERHQTALKEAGETSAGLTPQARTALARMSKRLAPHAEQADPGQFLFALQTYFALVVKLVTSVVVERTSRGDATPVHAWSRSDFQDLETGLRAARCGADDFPDAPGWAWYLDVWDRPMSEWLRSVTQHLHTLEFLTPETDPGTGNDLFGAFYMSLFPKHVRHSLGEHYTPAWLADHVLERVGFDQTPKGRLLDPTCGSGVFLLRALKHVRKASKDQEETERIPMQIVGMDVNPLAVLAARANYLLALRDRLDPDLPITAPIHLRDVVLQKPVEPAFDFVVGNPPWIAWDHLSSDYRCQTKELWQRYGLFSLSGNEARHGGGKKDLAMLVLYAAVDRYLRVGGRLGMVVTQTLLQTRGAGDGFRRFRLGNQGYPMKVLQVDDLVDIQPFETASNWTATIALEKGTPTTYPVPYVRWLRPADKGGAHVPPALPDLSSQLLEAFPIDPECLQSPWFLRPAGLDFDIDHLTGLSDYEGHLGANTGGANGVYWLKLLGGEGANVEVENLTDLGKQVLPAVRTLVEPDLLHPLVRWSDVRRFQADASVHLLLVQDPETRRGIDEARLREVFPKTYAYLQRFEPQLRRRAAYRRYQESAPFYSMYNVGEYSVAPHKVVWRRMDRLVRAAVLESLDVPLLGRRPVLCQETCAMVATETAEEAHYLAAVLNSTIIGFLVQAHNVRGGKGFGSPGMLEYLGIRRFDARNEDHRELARLSLTAHRARANGQDLGPIQRAIDETTARIYQIAPDDVRALAEFVENDR